MATFEIGQKVRFRGMEMPATIVSGPHPTEGGASRWLVTKADGNVTLASEARLSPLDDQSERFADIMSKAIYGNGLVHRGSVMAAKLRAAADTLLAELESPAKPGPLAVGDKIRILQRGHNGASVRAGDVLTVKNLKDELRFYTDTSVSWVPHWVFRYAAEGTGWERA